MKRTATYVALGIGLLLILAWLTWPHSEDAKPSSPPAATAAPTAAEPATKAAANTPPVVRPLPPVSSEVSHLADALNAPNGDIVSDCRVLHECIAAFRSNFPRDGNPVGSNAEITAALTGRNKLGLALIPPRHPAINAAGELCDRWGTPFFFHAESSLRMGVRSAGPDRKLYTADDTVVSP